MPHDKDEPTESVKKQRRGFVVGPENLPDGPWRRKITKVKKELIHKAKVKKAYAKIKAREEQAAASSGKPQLANTDGETQEHEANAVNHGEAEQIHPARQLMLKDEEAAQTGASRQKTELEEDGQAPVSDGARRRTRRPGYYDKQLQKAEENKKAAAARREEMARRQAEREMKIAERERYKKAMAKTRDRDGKKKLGRESGILLEKVKKLVAEQR
ncbi:hypothetical protein NLU13_0764 [Sarocladium strictum]|uniref:rRNA-processing protein FYV7 n=1 Tax=Sarocladium strictum TaxID=5046 RepID=A0AA39LBK6_SARSR|nr:hypothetical protein NLU13_0764 [Sarocladium strictum]